MSNVLRLERTARAWTFVLNHPDKRNAMSHELVEQLIEGIETARRADVRTLVFRGEGRNLSAGFDFTGYQNASHGDLVLRLIRVEQMLQSVAQWPGMTVALAHGRNFGAGVDLFAACKRRYCTEEATFRMPGLKFGLVLGTRRFRNLVGTSHAHSVLAGAREFDASEALAMGFVDQIVSGDMFDGLVADSDRLASLLDPETQADLYRILHVEDDDADMASLVRSVARPGLKERIKSYLDDPG